jgi:hypothetical protein
MFIEIRSEKNNKKSMLLPNLKYETTYIGENKRKEMQGPKHVR